MTERVGVIEYEVRADLSDILSSTSQLDKNLGKTEKSFDKVDRAAEQVSSTLSRLSTIAVSVVSALAVDRIIKYADAWVQVGNKVTNYLKDGQNLVDVQNEIFKTAQATATPIQAVATLYGRLEPATRGIINSGDELIRVTDTINKAFVVSGATSEEASSAIVQLSQAMSAGALRSEEFNSVNEQGPRIMQGIADYMGVARGELKGLAAQGKITTEVMVGALRQMSASVDAEFGNMNKTFEMKGTQALNNLTKELGSNTDVQRAVSGIGDAMVSLSENIDAAVKAGEAMAVLYGARIVGAMASATAESVKNTAASHAAAVAKAAETAEEVQVAKANTATAAARVLNQKSVISQISAERAYLATAQASLTAQLSAATTEKERTAIRLQLLSYSQAMIAAANAESAAVGQLAILSGEAAIAQKTLASSMTVAEAAAAGASVAMRTLNSVMSFLGGPMGVLMIAASAAYYWSSSISDAKEKAISFSKEVDITTEALRKLTNTQLEAQKVNLERALVAQTEALRDQQKEYDNLKGKLDQYSYWTDEQKKASPELVKMQQDLTLAAADLETKKNDLNQTESKLYATTQSLNGAVQENYVALNQEGASASFSAGMNRELNRVLKEGNELRGRANYVQVDEKPVSANAQKILDDIKAKTEAEKNYGTVIAARIMAEKNAKDAGVTDPKEIQMISDAAAEQWKLVNSRKENTKAAKEENSEAKKEATQRENNNQKIQEATRETEKLRTEYANLKINQDGSTESSTRLTQATAELEAMNQLNKKSVDDQVSALATQLLAQDKIKASYEQQVKAVQMVNSLSKEFNPVGQVTNDYEKQLKDLQAYKNMELITEQDFIAQKEALNYQYEQNRLAAAEAYFAAQSAGNAFMMDSLNALGMASTNALAGLMSGTMSVTEAMQNFANVILNQAVGALVEIGLNYVKNMILADTMAAAEKARQAASGAALAASVTAQVGMTTALAAQAAFASTAAIPIVGPAAAPAAAGAAAAAAQALGSPAIPLASIAGARRYGGPVNPGSAYRVNEGGAPEILQSGSSQYMIPNSRGEVVSNSDATNSGSGVTINVSNSIADTASVSTSYDEASKTVTLAINAVAQQLASRTGPISKGLAAGWNVNGRTA